MSKIMGSFIGGKSTMQKEGSSPFKKVKQVRSESTIYSLQLYIKGESLSIVIV